MDKPKKEPVTLKQSQDTKLCLNCGFPNRNTDSQCMYCRSSLIEDSGLFNWVRQTYYILRWRWQLKQKRDNLESKTPVYRSFGFFVLGLVLSGRSEFQQGLLAPHLGFSCRNEYHACGCFGGETWRNQAQR